MGSTEPTPAIARAAAATPTAAVDFLPDALSIERRQPPAFTRHTLYLLGALIAAFLIWAALSPVDVIVVARGKLITSGTTQVVQPLEMAVIRSLDVRVGDAVVKGQKLATLDQTFAEADVSQLNTKIASLAAQIERSLAELEGRSYAPGPEAGADAAMQLDLFTSRRAQYAARIDAFDKQIRKIHASIATREADQVSLALRLDVARELEAMRAALHQKDIGSKTNLLEARTVRLQVERDIQLARNEVLEQREDLARAMADREAYVQDSRQKASEEMISARREHDGLVKQLEKAEKRSSLVVLTAPADAIVLEVAQRSVGSVLKEAEQLFTLVPVDDVEAEVQVDSADIGNVAAGAAARIKLDAYPFQRYGTLDARVRLVSADSFSDKDRASKQQAFFRVRLDLLSRQLASPAPGFRLIPGMTLTAEIKAGERTVLSYLLYPVLRSLTESLREP